MTPPQIYSLAPCDNDTLRQMLDARLNCVHRSIGVPPQSLVRIDDSGYRALIDLSEGDSGYLLYSFRQVLSSAELRESKGRPYVVTADIIKLVHPFLDSYYAWQTTSINRRGVRDPSLEENILRQLNGMSE